MKIHSQILHLKTKESFEIINITPQLSAMIRECGIDNGFIIVSSRHTTTSLVVNEFEDRLVQDIKGFFEQLVPEGNKYLHNDIHLRDCPPDEPENAHSHIIAMLLSHSETLPVIGGKIAIGQWQSVMLVELDGPRDRTVQAQLIGNSL